MRRLRISAISYLNTAPLMWDFEHGHLAQHFDISYTVPSLCAQALAEDKADIGIIPAIAYQTIPSLTVIPEIAIAARLSGLPGVLIGTANQAQGLEREAVVVERA